MYIRGTLLLHVLYMYTGTHSHWLPRMTVSMHIRVLHVHMYMYTVLIHTEYPLGKRMIVHNSSIAFTCTAHVQQAVLIHTGYPLCHCIHVHQSNIATTCTVHLRL